MRRNRRSAVLVAGLTAGAPWCLGAAPDFRRAVNLVWFSATVEQRILEQQLENLVAMGVDSVALNVWWFQDNINSTQVAPNFNRYSSTDATLRQVIDAAHAHGLAVQLRPLVDLANDPSHWRGQIVGGDTWFNGRGGYGDYIRHMADIAQEKNVAMFSVGVELEAVASQETNWRNLIASVRSRYSGPLTYAANWGNPAIGSTINWWDAVDYIGIDAYYPLTAKNNPTQAELDAAWANRANLIESWRNSVAPGKTVLFTEVGYMNYDGANRMPWSFDAAAANDQLEQAQAYAAMLSQNMPRAWFGGAYWWAWDVGNANPNPIGYETMGKLAYDVMGAHYLPGYTLGPTWTGAVGNLWTSGGNWTNGAAPGTLTTAHFSSPGSGSTSIILGGNVPNMRLIFDGATTPAYTFAPGGTLTVNPGGGITITNTVTTTQTLNCAVALQGPAIFANGSTAPNQRLVINGPISAADAGLKRLSLIGGGSGQLNGAISDGAGTVAVWKGGGGSWTISGNNTYSGPTDICWGTILITSDTALGSGAGSTTVLSGASLVINPGMNIDETIQISGSGVGGQGALQRADVAPYGPTAWNGDIVVSGDAEIHNRAYNNPANPIGVWTLGGNISGGSPDTALNLRSGNSNPGFFRLTGANNTYLGRTLISGGKVILDGGDNTLPVTTTVVLDTYDRGMNVQAGVLDLNGTDQTIAGLTQVARATRPRVVNGQPATGSILTINNSGSFTYSGILQDGGGTLALAKLGAGALILTGGSSFSGGTHVGGGTLLLADADAIGTGSLDVAAGTVVFAASLPKAPKLRGAVVSGSGRIDLTNNDLVIDYSPLGPGDPGPIDELRGMIGGAYNFGDWNGAGIGSSQATANAFALGYAPASLLGITFFSGQSVDDSSLLIRYTRFGDSNLDGLVDLRDLNALAMHWQTSDYWSGGDFNYDGFIDMRDLYLLAINWQHSASAAVLAETLASMGLPNVSVPEPRWGIVAIAGMLGLAGIGKARISRRGPVPRPRPWVWRRVWDKLFSSFVSQ